MSNVEQSAEKDAPSFVTDRNGVWRKPPVGCDRLGCDIEWGHTHADLLSVTFETEDASDIPPERTDR